MEQETPQPETPNIPKKLVSVSEITAYMFCPRKLWLQKVKGIREPPSKEMILGGMKHKSLELFTNYEKEFITQIPKDLPKSELDQAYHELMRKCAIKAYQSNRNVAEKFDIILTTFLAEFLPTTEREIAIRIPPLLEAMKSYIGLELWNNLKPKYKSEVSIESEDLGIKGRIDRVEFSDSILFSEDIIPYEIKTREQEKIWDSDKIQLAAYALLLENRFRKKIPMGIIELRHSKKQIEITEELKAQVLEIADKVRNLQGEMPSSFSKCQSCKLKQDCLDN